MLSLEDRFKRFMLSIPSAESIDKLMQDCHLPDRQRADYLVCYRHFIIEQKSLGADPAPKIEAFLQKLADENRLQEPGRTGLAELLSKLPDGQALFDDLRERVVRRLDKLVAEADHQVEDTKRTFLIPGALGVLVVLNECAPCIFPDIAADRLFSSLNKAGTDGGRRYPHNQAIIFISEAHIMSGRQDATIFSTATLYAVEYGEHPTLNLFTKSLLQGWAKANGAGFAEETTPWGDYQARDPLKPINIVIRRRSASDIPCRNS
jgi:hypothetical protein